MIYNLVRKHAVDTWNRQFWILHGPKEENWSAPFLNLGNERVWRGREGRDSSGLRLDRPSRLLPPDNSTIDGLPVFIRSRLQYEVKYQLESNVNNIRNTFINFYFAFYAVNKQLFNDGIANMRFYQIPILLTMANTNQFS